jgi:hypothetical protein
VIGGVCQQGLLASRYSPLTRQIDPHWRSEIALLVREYVYAPLMCALPPKADICGALAHVRFGPCVDGAELARAFITFAALVGAAMCSAFECGTQGRWP